VNTWGGAEPARGTDPAGPDEPHGGASGHRRARSLVLSLMLLVVACAVVGLVSDLDQLRTLALGFDRRLLGPIFLLAPANYLFRFYKWRILLSRAGIDLPARVSLGVFMAGLSMTVTPAKTGELVKAYYLREIAGVPYSAGAAVVVAERILDSASVISLAALGLLAGVGVHRGGPWVVGVSAAALALTVGLLRSEGGLLGLVRLVRRLGAPGGRMAVFLEGFGSGSRRILDGQTFTWCTFVGVVSWSLEGLIVNLTLLGLGHPAPLPLGIAVVALASLAGALSMLPGGAGAAEATIMGLLLLYGYPRPVAGAVTIITRVSTLWLGVALGAVALVILERKLRLARSRHDLQDESRSSRALR